MIRPFSRPVEFDRHGRAWLPTASPGWTGLSHVHTGCALGWAEVDGKALIAIEGGGDAERPEVFERVVFTLTRPGLAALIADLQAVERRMGSAVVQPDGSDRVARIDR